MKREYILVTEGQLGQTTKTKSIEVCYECREGTPIRGTGLCKDCTYWINKE
tara:strand:+ start:329 stop:481 length:153 start_codon:yes stop_codon:yes gene_type:complete